MMQRKKAATSEKMEVFEAESSVPVKKAPEAKKRPANLPEPTAKPLKLADDKEEMRRPSEESARLEQAQREVEAERAQLRAELKAKKAKKKAEEAKQKAEEAKEKAKKEKKEAEEEAAALAKRKATPAFYTKECVKAWNENLAQKVKADKEEKAGLKKLEEEKQSRQAEVERLLREAGQLERAAEVRKTLGAMKQGAYTGKKRDPLPPEIQERVLVRGSSFTGA